MIYTTHYIQIVIQIVFSKQICMLIYVNQNNVEKNEYPGHSYSNPPPIKFSGFFPSRTFSSVNIAFVQKNILNETLAL